MNRITLFLTLVVAIGLTTIIFTPKNIPTQKENIARNKKISGTYEALNFMGARQTFPSGNIPEYAYAAAWETAKRMQDNQVSTRFDTDPWESIGPHNRGGRILTLTFNPQNPNTLYAGSASGGLWRSYTAGVGAAAWERVNIDLPVLGVSCITFAPGDSMTMYIGTGEVYNVAEAGTGAAYRRTRGSWGIGILKSSDGGETWEKSLDWSLNENHGIWAIRIHPSNPNIIYAATTDGVYKSEDAGASWQQIHDVVMANDLVIHPDHPNTLLVGCGNLNSSGRGIYRSTDGGAHWIQIHSGLPSYKGKVQFGISPSNPDIVYASIGNSLGGDDEASWLCQSSDFGATWTIKTTTDYSRWQGWYSHDVAVHPDNPDKITVIGINVWQSDNSGETLNVITEGGVGFANPPIEGPDGAPNYVHSDAHDVIYHPENPDIIYVASDGGIHRSLDGGETFASCNGGLQTAQFYNGFSNSHQDETFCMGGLQDNGTIRWNGDKTWTRVLGGDGSWSAINPMDDYIFYTSWQYLNIIGTLDGGENYLQPEVPFLWVSAFIAPYAIAPSAPNILYACSAVVGKSTDYGETWTTSNNGNPLNAAQAPVLSIAISYQNPDIAYVATAPYQGTSAKVYQTTDGNYWFNITGTTLPNRYPMDIAVDPTNDQIAYITYAGFDSGHVYKTTDGGISWSDISGDLPDVPTNAVTVDPLFPNNIYVGNDLGVFASPDGGESWEVYQDGLPGTVMVFDLTVSPVNRKLRVATHGNGAYQRDLIEVPSATKELAWVNNLQLKIFPNPSSDRTNLTYNLAESADISFSLLSANGQMIRDISQQKQSIGNHHLSIPVNDLPRGLYYLQMQIKGKQLMKKIAVE